MDNTQVCAPQFGKGENAPRAERPQAKQKPVVKKIVREEVPVHKRVDKFKVFMVRNAPFGKLKEFAENNGIMHVKFVQRELERVRNMPRDATRQIMESGKFQRPKEVVHKEGRKTNVGNPCPKGPGGGGEQKQTSNPKKAAARARKLEQKKTGKGKKK